MWKLLIVAAVLLAPPVYARPQTGQAISDDSINQDVINDSLRCIIVFDAAKPLFPDRADEIQKYRGRAADGYMKVTGADAAGLAAAIDDARAQLQPAMSAADYDIAPDLNDCAFIYADF